ncbi:MAG: sugar transferase [Bacteroidia bacterium]
MSLYNMSVSKRLLDIFFSLLVLPIALPVMLLSIVLIGLTTAGPVFFVQQRVGLNGKSFNLIKIRTLKRSFQSLPGAQHDELDITMVGRFLRKFRFDEIPQIWNILIGEMSWVGPRPEVPYYFDHFKALHPEYEMRQLTRPGITGLAQLQNPNASPNENLEKLKYDLEYVRNSSFGMDINILLRSFLFVWK